MRNKRFLLSEALDINDPHAVSDRINLYQKIISQSHHQGEKDNAKVMMDKLIAKAQAAGSYRPSANAQTNRTYSRANYSYNSKPTEWTLVNSMVKEVGPIVYIELSTAAMAKHGIPTTNEGYGRRVVFQKGSAQVVVYQSDNELNGKYGVSVRQTQTSNAQDVNNLILFLTKMEKPSHEKTDNVSSNVFKIVFVGHYQDDKSDKVWGWGVKGNTIYQFWGRRGGKPSLKVFEKTDANLDMINKLAKTKKAKGYQKVPADTFELWLRKVLDAKPKFTN